MVVFSKLTILAGTVAGRDLFQAPVNPAFLSHTRPAQAYPYASPDVRMVAQPTDSIPVYAIESEDTSQGWTGTVLCAAAVGAACGAYAQSSKKQVASRPNVAALALSGKAFVPEKRSDPVMTVQAEDEYLYGLPGSIPPAYKWDPLNFVKVYQGWYPENDPKDLALRLRESELIHGRLAMMASAGFLTQEAYHPLFNGQIDGPAISQIGQTPILFWAILTAGTSYFEIKRLQKFEDTYETGAVGTLKPGYIPGDIGFDPLKLKYYGKRTLGSEEAAFREMQNKELANGRLAMVAAAGFITQEMMTGQPWLAYYQ